MKLEYLADGSPDCPLIRLYDFTQVEAGRLLDVLTDLAADRCEQVPVHKLPWVQPLGDCHLTFRVGSWDQAVVRKAGILDFACGFTNGTWDNVAALVEPFAGGAGGFQWLAGVPGETALLLTSSTSGQW
jgi:hypothetical protein